MRASPQPRRDGGRITATSVDVDDEPRGTRRRTELGRDGQLDLRRFGGGASGELLLRGLTLHNARATSSSSHDAPTKNLLGARDPPTLRPELNDVIDHRVGHTG